MHHHEQDPGIVDGFHVDAGHLIPAEREWDENKMPVVRMMVTLVIVAVMMLML